MVAVNPNPIRDEWGTRGSGEGQLNSPEGIAISDSGNVFVVDTGNNRVQVFDLTGGFIRAWGTAGSGNGQFQSPHGVALDSSGNVYVVDTGNNRIQVFTPTGQFLRKWGSFGTGATQFNMPWGITINTTGYVFITDTNNNRVQAYDQLGNFIRSFNQPYGIINLPRGVAIDNYGKLVVVLNDTDSHHYYYIILNVATAGYEFIGHDTRFKDPYGIAYQHYGKFYLVDTGNNRILQFPDWHENSEPEAIVNGFTGPRGIAFDAAGHIYVTDTGNHRIVKFDPLLSSTTVQGIVALIIVTILSIAICMVLSSPYYAQFVEQRKQKEQKQHENIVRQAEWKPTTTPNQGAFFCTHCGVRLPPDAAYCDMCGTPQQR